MATRLLGTVVDPGVIMVGLGQSCTTPEILRDLAEAQGEAPARTARGHWGQVLCALAQGCLQGGGLRLDQGCHACVSHGRRSPRTLPQVEAPGVGDGPPSSPGKKGHTHALCPI